MIRVPLAASTVTEVAAAKINLALAVTGRRPDGYHLLDTLAVFAVAGDGLCAAPADDLSLEIGGPFGPALTGSGPNLVIRAAEALREAAFSGNAPGARLSLDKQLPVASGIGGGSADAAAALRALNRLWGLDWSLDRLAGVGLALGADIPMCLVSRPLRARGIGEQTGTLGAFPVLQMVLVNPGIAVSTPDVFTRLSGAFSGPLPDAGSLHDLDGVLTYLHETANDLEAPAIATEPVIADVLDALRSSAGCRLARMSGSGATCFGIYPDAAAATAAAAAISAENRKWWIVTTTSGRTRGTVDLP